MPLPSLQLDNAHVGEHLVGGLHARVAQSHEHELEGVVPTSVEEDEECGDESSGDAGGGGDAEVGVEESESCEDLKWHEPEVVELEHNVGELLGVYGHVVDDHSNAVGLPGRARETETFAVERSDES